METTASNDGLEKEQEATPTPKTKKSILELVKTIPRGRYAGLSQILEPHEIPKERE